MGLLLAQLVNAVVTILIIAIIARALISFAPLSRDHPVVQVLHQITEPILRPIRNLMPQVGMFDFSPMIAILLLSVGRTVLAQIFISLFP